MTRLQQAFTLVELMVAMTIGLVIVGAVGFVFMNSRDIYYVQDSLARLQENARFATEFITRDLRMARFFGCMDDPSKIASDVTVSAGSLLDTVDLLEGYEQDTTTWMPSNSTWEIANVVAGTDALTIRFLDGTDPLPVLPPYATSEAAPLTVDTDNDFSAGDVVAVSDCASADVFQITGTPSTGSLEHATNDATINPGNTSGLFSKFYDKDSFVMPLRAHRYYIRNNAAGNPSLYRQTLITGNGVIASTPEELVEGIENMQILYGEDTLENDSVPDLFVDATSVGDWSNVVSLRITLLAYTIAATEDGRYANLADGSNTPGTPPSYDVNFTPGNANDDVGGITGNRKRKRFLTTVLIRNRP